MYEYTASFDGICSIEACIYLFIVNFFLIQSSRFCSINELKIVNEYNDSFLFNILKFLCVIFSIYLVFELPQNISHFFSGHNFADMRDELYGTQLKKSNFLIGLISRGFGSSSILLLIIPAVRIFLLKKMNTWNYYAILIYFLLKINIIFSVISRAIIVFSCLEILVVLFFFHSFISSRIKRIILICSLFIIPSMFTIFTAITQSRFGNKGIEGENFATLRYMGESNLNFMALAYPDLKTPFHGYSTFPLYRRIIGLPYNDGTSRDGSSVYDLYIQKEYKYPNPTYIFHGLAGVFFFNWGKFGALMIAISFFFVMKYSFRRLNNISTFSIIMCVIQTSFVAKGIFFGDYASESGNLLIIYLIMIYFYLRKFGVNISINNK